MSRPSTRRLLRLLQDADLRPADGLPVHVMAVDVVRREGRDQVRVRYAVDPVPPGEAWQPLPRPEETLEEYADSVAEELHGWSTEHVRRYRPLPPPDLDEVARSLPPAGELWASFRRPFAEVTDRADGGFDGTLHGCRVDVAFGADEWHRYVLWCEVGARRDTGVDAARAVDGPFLATEHVDELVASGSHPSVRLALVDGRLRRQTAR